jgi:transposase InsO family protein
MVYRFMRENQGRYTVREMVELFGVSCSAYYRWAKYGVSERRKEADAELVDLIRRIQERDHYRYGSPRVKEELRNCSGKRVSLKNAARLTRGNGLNAKRRRKFIPTANSRHGLPVCENILNRKFHAEGAGQKRVSSYQRYAITCLRTTGGWVYLTAVLDLYDRKIIGRAFSTGMETLHTAISSVNMAFAGRKAQEGLVFHSDRGV